MNLRDTITQRLNKYVEANCNDKNFVRIISWDTKVDRGGNCCCSYSYDYYDMVHVRYERGKTPKGNDRKPGSWTYYGQLEELIGVLDA